MYSATFKLEEHSSEIFGVYLMQAQIKLHSESLNLDSSSFYLPMYDGKTVITVELDLVSIF